MQLPKDPLLGIDGDMILYAAAAAAETRCYHIFKVEGEKRTHVTDVPYAKDADLWVQDQRALGDTAEYVAELEIDNGTKRKAMHNAKEMIIKCLEHCHTDKFQVYLSDPKWIFREDLARQAPYKGTRWNAARRQLERERGVWTAWLDATEDTWQCQEKPYHYKAVRRYLLQYQDAIQARGEEADDMLGIMQTRAWPTKGRKRVISQDTATTIICTLDKDLRTIPGFHYHWRDEEITWVSIADAIFNFYCQLLTGDREDTIVGLPKIAPVTFQKYGVRKVKGMGRKTAEKVLAGCKTHDDYLHVIWDIYLDYVIEYHPEVEDKAALCRALINEAGSLVCIRRTPGEIWQLPKGFKG